MTVKERIIEKLEGLDEARLLELEGRLDELQADTPLERKLRLLDAVADILADPEDYAEFEREARRRPIYGSRALDLEPDNPQPEEQVPVGGA